MLDNAKNNDTNTHDLVDTFLRDTQDPADTSRRKQLEALLEDPRMKELARLLQDETVGTKTREIITDYVTQSHLLELPDDALLKIVQKLDNQGKSAFFATNFGLFRKFQAALALREYVVNGNENIAKIILKRENPESALESSVLKKGNVTDPGGRAFENISSLQYAYWMGDWYMVDMLLGNLPKEYLAEAQKQIDEVKNGCIKYQLYLDIDASVEEKDFAVKHLAPVILPQENVKYDISLPPADYDYAKAMPIPEGKRRVLVTVKGEQHYDYQPLIKALKDYSPIYQRWEASGCNDSNLRAEIIRHWCKIVGLVQRYATAFLAQQYCHPDRSFENVKFDEPEFKNRLLNVTRQGTSWFLRASGLGDSFGIYRGACGGGGRSWAMADRACWAAVYALVDGAAVERLCKESPEKMMSVLDKHFAGLSHTTQPG